MFFVALCFLAKRLFTARLRKVILSWSCSSFEGHTGALSWDAMSNIESYNSVISHGVSRQKARGLRPSESNENAIILEWVSFTDERCSIDRFRNWLIGWHIITKKLIFEFSQVIHVSVKSVVSAVFILQRMHYPSGGTWANILQFVWLCVSSKKTGTGYASRRNTFRSLRSASFKTYFEGKFVQTRCARLYTGAPNEDFLQTTLRTLFNACFVEL